MTRSAAIPNGQAILPHEHPCELRHLIAGAGVLVGKSTSRLALSLVFFRHSNSPILVPFRPASKREASGVPDQLLERVLSLAVYPEELTYICELCYRGGSLWRRKTFRQSLQ
jgi:hypothetical protein